MSICLGIERRGKPYTSLQTKPAASAMLSVLISSQADTVCKDGKELRYSPMCNFCTIVWTRH